MRQINLKSRQLSSPRGPIAYYALEAGQYRAMPPVVSQWQVKRESSAIDGRPPKVELSRSYTFSEAPTPDSSATLELVCTIVSAGLVTGSSSVPGRLNIDRQLRIFFRPLRLKRRISATFELFTTDRSEGGKLTVYASPIGHGDTVLLAANGRSRLDTAALLSAIMSGKDMTFMLAHEARPLIQFHLNNDLEFRRLCEETYKQFIELEFAYRKARLQSARARGRPKHRIGFGKDRAG
jgi:hypothetical protein